MLSAIRTKYLTGPESSIFYILSLSLMLAIIGYIVSNEWLVLLFPFLLVLGGVFLLDIKAIYYLLWASIPISIQFYFPNGLSTDLPSEPLMVLLMLGVLAIGISKIKQVPATYILHPITILLFLHFAWICLTIFNAHDKVIAFKFAVAKFWYIIPFYVGSLFFLRTLKDYKRLILSILIPLASLVLIIIIKHAIEGFTFVAANKVIHPFFRNHVNYASILVVFLPFVWFYHRVQTKHIFYIRLLLLSIGVMFLAGIFLSYTRAAFVSLGLIVFSYYIIRHRLIKYAIVLSLLLSSWWIYSLVNNNKYLRYAPNYEQTIAHKDFESLLSATYKLKDISTMERVYRWVAGFRMVHRHPWMGFGPNNFYSNYKSYTIRAFETYVSDNPEKSGIHSYYLMTAVDQGLPGLFLFCVLSFLSLIYGEYLYHRIKNKELKLLLMAALLSQIAILSILIINDMLETVKVGPFFFLNLAIIVGIDLHTRKLSQTSDHKKNIQNTH